MKLTSEDFFNIQTDRRNTSCIKWDFQKDDFGTDNLYPFTIADADYPSCPEILSALNERVQHGIFGYTDPDASYFSAVQSWCRNRHGFTPNTEWIVPVAGIIPGISYVLDALLPEGARVLVQPPVYDPFYSVVKACKKVLVKCPLQHDSETNTYSIDFNRFREAASSDISAMLLCSPHNPVGRVWTAEELQQILEICREYGILLICDEIHWDLMIGNSRHISLGSMISPDDKVIVCTSASKTFNIAGLMCSNFIIPNQELRDAYRNYLYGRYIFCPNSMGLLATQTAYEKGADWVDAQNAHLTENYLLAKEFLETNLPLAKISPLQGTYLMWIDLSDYKKTSREWIQTIASCGAALGDGTHYDEDFEGFLRMNLACPKAQLEAGLKCITLAAEKLLQEA